MAAFTTDLLVGYGLAIVAVLSLASATACTQAVIGTIPITQIILGQFVLEVLLCLPVMVKERTLPKVESEKCVPLGMLALIKFAAHILFYLSPKFAPAGIAQAMFNTAGMLTCIMRDTIKKRGCPLMISLPFVLCLVGILLTSQPTFLGFSALMQHPTFVSTCYQNGSTYFPSYWNNSSAIEMDNFVYIPKSYNIGLGYTLSLLGGVGQGVTYIITVEFLSKINPNTVNFWIGSIGTLLSALGLAIQRPILPHGATCWAIATGSSLGDALASNLINYALPRIYATAMTILLTLDIVIVAVFQYTILRHIHRGHENWEEYLGLVILTVANVLYPILSWRERRLEEYSNLEEETNSSNELK